ncbi:MAG: ferredoxin, partial [Clostridia bacterium]|nr:ferredoxin [Clostridia bacterium]
PDVFEMLDTGIAHAKAKAEGESIISLALEAKESCPVEAIESK